MLQKPRESEKHGEQIPSTLRAGKKVMKKSSERENERTKKK